MAFLTVNVIKNPQCPQDEVQTPIVAPKALQNILAGSLHPGLVERVGVQGAGCFSPRCLCSDQQKQKEGWRGTGTQARAVLTCLEAKTTSPVIQMVPPRPERAGIEML